MPSGINPRPIELAELISGTAGPVVEPVVEVVKTGPVVDVDDVVEGPVVDVELVVEGPVVEVEDVVDGPVVDVVVEGPVVEVVVVGPVVLVVVVGPVVDVVVVGPVVDVVGPEVVEVPPVVDVVVVPPVVAFGLLCPPCGNATGRSGSQNGKRLAPVTVVTPAAVVATVGAVGSIATDSDGISTAAGWFGVNVSTLGDTFVITRGFARSVTTLVFTVGK